MSPTNKTNKKNTAIGVPARKKAFKEKRHLNEKTKNKKNKKKSNKPVTCAHFINYILLIISRLHAILLRLCTDVDQGVRGYAGGE